MHQIVLANLKKSPQMYDYLKHNSHWIKYLNRHPQNYKAYETFIKDKYKLKITDKLSTTIDDISLVLNVVNSMK